MNISRIAHWLKLDQNQDEEQRRMRMMLYCIGSLMTLVTFASWLVTLTASYRMATVILTLGLMISTALMALNWSGRLNWARVLYPGFTLLFLVIVIWNGDGLYDEVLLAVPALIAMAGLLMGRRGVVVFTILCIVVVSGFGYAHLQHWIAEYTKDFQLARMVILDFMVTLSGVLIYLAIDNLAVSIARLRHNEQSLSAKNQELEDIRASLEDQVIERTRRAEAVRQEAENAHHDLELQMWQIAGQEQLSEILRGEQDLSDLADRIMSFVCRYVDAPFGALFVSSEVGRRPGLQFAGGYACRPGPQTPACFQVGEGLVGQAAVEKRLLLVENIPARQVQICSGLGNILPTDLLLLPLLYARVVIGVIELAGLTPFAPHQIRFLNRSAESIAITLHTTQTRERLQVLLEETQQQAMELQAQEEELRAANEELRSQAEMLSALQGIKR